MGGGGRRERRGEQGRRRGGSGTGGDGLQSPSERPWGLVAPWSQESRNGLRGNVVPVDEC